MGLLIFTPTWIDPATGEDAIKPECEAAIKSQILRAGNEFDWHVTTDNPYPIGDHANVLHQYRAAREYFLHGTWEALLTIEHDNVLPDWGAVQRLLDTPGDVVYAPYMLRHGKPVLSTWQYIGERNLGQSLSNYPRELRLARKNVIWRVCGCGMGCTLFRRAALEMLEFEASTARNPCPDLGFAQKAIKAGLLSNGRFDVPVLHWSEGEWLHPYHERRSIGMKYIALHTMNVLVDGQSMPIVEGQEYDLPIEAAAELQRAGYVRPAALAADAPVERAVVETQEQAIAPAQRRTRTRREAAA